ncbi:hypothetical protein PAPYR_6639 [Paratrimastix pyriformis]|uniref:Protein kinase domain-containing protein n=1 Tax=Paratrimastix pyriformis TaxID=342808 RepID=A0ABQ8UK40_9EUKA|nr:hypothetical protein PAPYR_6639 [Paratrimastix pyriformis]
MTGRPLVPGEERFLPPDRSEEIARLKALDEVQKEVEKIRTDLDALPPPASIVQEADPLGTLALERGIPLRRPELPYVPVEERAIWETYPSSHPDCHTLRTQIDVHRQIWVRALAGVEMLRFIVADVRRPRRKIPGKVDCTEVDETGCKRFIFTPKNPLQQDAHYRVTFLYRVVPIVPALDEPLTGAAQEDAQGRELSGFSSVTTPPKPPRVYATPIILNLLLALRVYATPILNLLLAQRDQHRVAQLTRRGAAGKDFSGHLRPPAGPILGPDGSPALSRRKDQGFDQTHSDHEQDTQRWSSLGRLTSVLLSLSPSTGDSFAHGCSDLRAVSSTSLECPLVGLLAQRPLAAQPARLLPPVQSRQHQQRNEPQSRQPGQTGSIRTPHFNRRPLRRLPRLLLPRLAASLTQRAATATAIITIINPKGNTTAPLPPHPAISRNRIRACCLGRHHPQNTPPGHAEIPGQCTRVATNQRPIAPLARPVGGHPAAPAAGRVWKRFEVEARVKVWPKTTRDIHPIIIHAALDWRSICSLVCASFLFVSREAAPSPLVDTIRAMTAQAQETMPHLMGTIDHGAVTARTLSARSAITARGSPNGGSQTARSPLPKRPLAVLEGVFSPTLPTSRGPLATTRTLLSAGESPSPRTVRIMRSPAAPEMESRLRDDARALLEESDKKPTTNQPAQPNHTPPRPATHGITPFHTAMRHFFSGYQNFLHTMLSGWQRSTAFRRAPLGEPDTGTPKMLAIAGTGPFEGDDVLDAHNRDLQARLAHKKSNVVEHLVLGEKIWGDLDPKAAWPSPRKALPLDGQAFNNVIMNRLKPDRIDDTAAVPPSSSAPPVGGTPRPTSPSASTLTTSLTVPVTVPEPTEDPQLTAEIAYYLKRRQHILTRQQMESHRRPMSPLSSSDSDTDGGAARSAPATSSPATRRGRPPPAGDMGEFHFEVLEWDFFTQGYTVLSVLLTEPHHREDAVSRNRPLVVHCDQPVDLLSARLGITAANACLNLKTTPVFYAVLLVLFMGLAIEKAGQMPGEGSCVYCPGSLGPLQPCVRFNVRPCPTDPNGLEIVPYGCLLPLCWYTVTLSESIESRSGHQMPASVAFSFRTEGGSIRDLSIGRSIVAAGMGSPMPALRLIPNAQWGEHGVGLYHSPLIESDLAALMRHPAITALFSIRHQHLLPYHGVFFHEDYGVALVTARPPPLTLTDSETSSFHSGDTIQFVHCSEIQINMHHRMLMSSSTLYPRHSLLPFLQASLLREQRTTLSYPQVVRLAFGIASGVAFLHGLEPPVAHGALHLLEHIALTPHTRAPVLCYYGLTRPTRYLVCRLLQRFATESPAGSNPDADGSSSDMAERIGGIMVGLGQLEDREMASGDVDRSGKGPALVPASVMGRFYQRYRTQAPTAYGDPLLQEALHDLFRRARVRPTGPTFQLSQPAQEFLEARASLPTGMPLGASTRRSSSAQTPTATSTTRSFGASRLSTRLAAEAESRRREALLALRYFGAADVCRFGMVLCEMATNRPPGTMDPEAVVKELVPLIPWQAIRDMVKACLDPCPGQRPTMGELVETLRGLLNSMETVANAFLVPPRAASGPPKTKKHRTPIHRLKHDEQATMMSPRESPAQPILIASISDTPMAALTRANTPTTPGSGAAPGGGFGEAPNAPTPAAILVPAPLTRPGAAAAHIQRSRLPVAPWTRNSGTARVVPGSSLPSRSPAHRMHSNTAGRSPPTTPGGSPSPPPSPPPIPKDLGGGGLGLDDSIDSWTSLRHLVDTEASAATAHAAYPLVPLEGGGYRVDEATMYRGPPRPRLPLVDGEEFHWDGDKKPAASARSATKHTRVTSLDRWWRGKCESRKRTRQKRKCKSRRKGIFTHHHR